MNICGSSTNPMVGGLRRPVLSGWAGLMLCGFIFMGASATLCADELVRLVQTKLSALGYYKGRVDGSAGSMTSAAIRRYQLAQALKVTGELNQQTIDALGLDEPAPAPSYKAIRALFVDGPLAEAGSGVQVRTIREVQKQLAELGCYAGPHNGLPGLALAEAVREWQRGRGLEETGELDAATLASLGIAVE